MSLFTRFRRSAPQQSPIAVAQYDLPTGDHQQIVNDLITAGATPAEAVAIVAKNATRNWNAATGNHTRGELRQAELNALDGGVGGGQR